VAWTGQRTRRDWRLSLAIGHSSGLMPVRTHRRLRPAGLLASLLAACLASAGVRAGTDAGELYRLSGLAGQNQGNHAQLATMLGEAAEGSFDPDAALIVRAVTAHFAPAALRAEAVRLIEAAWDSAAAQRAAQWLESELGRRVTALEERSTSTEALAGLAAFIERLEAQPPPEERVALVRRLLAAYGGIEFVVEANLATSLAFFAGLNELMPDAERDTLEDIRAFVEAGRSGMRASMQQRIVPVYLYTYAPLTNAELAAYVDFLESPAGRWYVDATSAAYVEPWRRLCVDLAPAVSEALREAPPPGAAAAAPR